jgi:curved DNA-binding protein CbpA
VNATTTDWPDDRRTHYDVLGVHRDASEEEIRRAHRALVKVKHPDVCREADAEREFKAVQRAFDVLSDAMERAEYDQELCAGSARARVPDDAVDTLLEQFFDFVQRKKKKGKPRPKESKKKGRPDIGEIPDGISTAIEDPFNF